MKKKFELSPQGLQIAKDKKCYIYKWRNQRVWKFAVYYYYNSMVEGNTSCLLGWFNSIEDAKTLFPNLIVPQNPFKRVVE